MGITQRFCQVEIEVGHLSPCHIQTWGPAGTSVGFPHVVSELAKSTVSSDEIYSSSVVGSAVDERGVEVFDDMVGSVTQCVRIRCWSK